MLGSQTNTGDELEAESVARRVGRGEDLGGRQCISFSERRGCTLACPHLFLTTCILAAKERHKIFIFKDGWMRTREMNAPVGKRPEFDVQNPH